MNPGKLLALIGTVFYLLFVFLVFISFGQAGIIGFIMAFALAFQIALPIWIGIMVASLIVWLVTR